MSTMYNYIYTCALKRSSLVHYVYFIEYFPSVAKRQAVYLRYNFPRLNMLKMTIRLRCFRRNFSFSIRDHPSRFHFTVTIQVIENDQDTASLWFHTFWSSFLQQFKLKRIRTQQNLKSDCEIASTLCKNFVQIIAKVNLCESALRTQFCIDLFYRITVFSGSNFLQQKKDDWKHCITKLAEPNQ